MTVDTVTSESEVVVHVDGDLGSAATLVQLHSELSAVAFTANTPIVVDLSAATGDSAAVHRLLERTAKILARRGWPLTVVDRELVRT